MTNSLCTVMTADAYALKASDVAVENAVSAYMTLKKPEQLPSQINVIASKYQLYSPFICKIISALQTGSIQGTVYTGSYSDADAVSAVAPYAYLLNNDPISAGNTPDLTYCAIMPHWFSTVVTLTADQYRFLNNIVRIYARNKVSLSSSVIVA